MQHSELHESMKFEIKLYKNYYYYYYYYYYYGLRKRSANKYR